MSDQPLEPGRDEPSRLPRKVIRLADLSNRRETAVILTPSGPERAAVADALGIVGVRKLRFEGTLIPEGRSDWRLEATLGATVVQDCVATLDPVTTRIDEPVLRRYLADIDPPEPGEIEMPEDDSVEGLPAALDLAEVMIEALALALPVYPRSAAAGAGDISVTEPGKTPLTDEAVRPFSGLAGLRDKLGGGDGDGTP